MKMSFFGSKRFRVVLALTLVATSLIFFGLYIAHHGYLLTQLGNVSAVNLVILFGLYLLWFGAIVLTFTASLRICRTKMPVFETLLLNAWTVFTNFSLPGQSGPVVRGWYLKSRYRVPVKNFVFATLTYYFFYAVVNVIFLLINKPLWLLLALLIVFAVSGFIIFSYKNRKHVATDRLDFGPKSLLFMLAVVLAQCFLHAVIFGFELAAVNAHAGLSSVIIYTGAANLALFASLTPAAVGIRESFLLFSQKLHHISTHSVLAASVIDRGIFLILLACLFAFAASFHAHNRFAKKLTVSAGA